MAFDQVTRNRLQRFVTDARELLTKEFTRQLQHEYGLDPSSGSVTLLSELKIDDTRRETARILRETLQHYLSTSPSSDKKEVLERIVREEAFTILNRLAALRMAEARGILIESLANGFSSRGFQLYTKLAGTSLGETGGSYRCYLFSIFDEFALDLKVLFDRFAPSGRLFPRESALLELLALINSEDIASLWKEDETIGWIYQYFNDPIERKKMRDLKQGGSSAPRNSRELAVRNQFFTPRYVVEFLTDNTLGRIWYEMTQGQTRLTEQCRFLVRRPDEVFLGPQTSGGEVGLDEVRDMARLLTAGDVAAFPEFTLTETSQQQLRMFALCVDGYSRRATDGGGHEQWLTDFENRVLKPMRLEDASTQELMDGLFLIQRREHMTSMGQSEFAHGHVVGASNEVRRRALRSRESNLSQEGLLKQPIFIPYRPTKDPRTILMLDPACGSMHFGLYAFDLFEVIYEEWWDRFATDEEKSEVIEDCQKSQNTAVQEIGESDEQRIFFLRQVPRLIIENNIHGIDIDPRAVQIAGLSLWLRAQRTWHYQNLKPADRPQVRRSNIVCAEPMPGEGTLLKEFVDKNLAATPELRLLGQLVRHIFDDMKLAGEAGSLLMIETEIANAVSEAKQKWLEAPTPKQESLFGETARPEQQRLGYEVAGITDEMFWERAEKLIYEALQSYAEQSENGGGYQRRLFADDAARGFAFIDLCRKRYDVVLMNPPFGEASINSREYLYEHISEAARDLFAGFVSRFNDLLSNMGRLGVLSNRTAFFSDFLSSWRLSNFLGNKARLSLMSDLGYGVLDAVVEASAYICERSHGPMCQFINILDASDKDQALLQQVRAIRHGGISDGTVTRELRDFQALPDYRFLYHLQPFWINKLNLSNSHPLFVSKAGLTSGDDTRNLRLFWELNLSGEAEGRWRWLAKGGEFSRYRSDLHLLIDWRNKDFLHRLRNSELYGYRGVTYTERTTSNLSARVLNEGSCFSGPGPGIIPNEAAHLHFLLAYLNSFVATYCIESIVGGGDFSMRGTAARHLEPGYMKYLPSIRLSPEHAAWFKEKVGQLLGFLGQLVEDETDTSFSKVYVSSAAGLEEHLTAQTRRRFAILEGAYGLVESMENTIASLLEIPIERLQDAYSDTGWPWPGEDLNPEDDHSSILGTDPLTPLEIPREIQSMNGRYRFEMKLSCYLHSAIERYSSLTRIAPAAICRLLAQSAILSESSLKQHSFSVVSYLLGAVFGRWDVRLSTGEVSSRELSDPFARLPVCVPGMLQNEGGSPAGPEDAPKRYPLRVSWSGILVDAPGHEEDIEVRTREVLHVIWPERGDAIEQEACEILGVRSLRDYFRKPSLFFAGHLSRYSKSRRQAPIYWPLATPSGSYTLWLYYHRLDAQTLYRCVVDFVEPKLRESNDALGQLRTKTNRTSDEERELERLQDFVLELQAFRDELLRLAQIPWQPNLNDGVQITAAPLWKLFRLPKWQKTSKETWANLEKGEFDWAHLAMNIWPERVVPKCVNDRSLAIAHGLEDLFWVEDELGWRQLQSPLKEIEDQKQRRRSEAGTRLKKLLANIAEGKDKQLPSQVVRQHLAEGDWDDREVALLLYPHRVAEKCWDDPVLAKKFNLKLPTQRTKASLQQFIKKVVAASCPDLAPQFDAALSGREETFAVLWSELNGGDNDRLAIALSLWPDRVIDKCLSDLDMAEHHGVQKYFWCQHPLPEWRRREEPEVEVANEVARRRGSGQQVYETSA